MKMFRLLFYLMFLIYSEFLIASNQSPNTFLFCLKPELQPLVISLNRGKPSVGIVELDNFINDYYVTHIEPWIPNAKEVDKSGDIYLNRIYRVYINKDKIKSISKAISSIQNIPYLLYAEPEVSQKLFYKPDDPRYNSQCSLEAVKANLAWDYWDIPNKMPGDKNILLASVDTGVDYSHPDLIDNIWVNQVELLENAEVIALSEIIDLNNDGYFSSTEINEFMSTQDDLNGDGIRNLRDALHIDSPFSDGSDNDNNGYIDDIYGWDAAGSLGTADNDPFPKMEVQAGSEWSHGTHVAGILAATTDNAVGMASAMFNGKILSVKCSYDAMTGDEPPIERGYEGIYYAAYTGYNSGARTIINCSWGSSSSTSHQAAIDIAYGYGAIIVAAAGNGIEDLREEEFAAHYPASYNNVVSVCALNCNGKWGGWATYHTSVDLAAPGDNILSTIIGGGYQSWDGSSMASPNVASVMGLVWSYHNSWNNADIIEQVILAADTIIYEQNPDYLHCNDNEGKYCLGSGMVDAQKSIAQGFSPKIELGPFIFNEITGDSDGVVNPGEKGYLEISLKNIIGWANAENVNVVLSTDNPSIIIIDGNAEYGNILSGDSLYNNSDQFIFELLSDIELGNIEFKLNITGNNGEYQYNDILQYLNISVTLNQRGFPISSAELRSSPLIIDYNNDNKMEIIIGDNNGFIHIYNDDGSELQNNTFPFYTGGQVWASASSADMDSDGIVDFVVNSKSKHLYIFDQYGLKIDYFADQYLMGTPAIGNLDEDSYLEVVFCGYASSNQIHVINSDGSKVEGFPLSVEGKIKAGVALKDFNGNGLDDIVVGTDNNKIYLIYDNGTIAPGFPYTTGDKIQIAPSIIDIEGEQVILVGSHDSIFYALNSDASLRFKIPTEGKNFTSPSSLIFDGKTNIFFGSNDLIYAIDEQGNYINGWPIKVNGEVIGSIVSSDLDSDGIPELVATTNLGDIIALHYNGDYVKYFPISISFPFSGSPMITDLDSDGDLEIFSGSGSDLVAIDIKENGSVKDYWNEYRGGSNRRGYHFINGGCTHIDACNYNNNSIIDDGTCIYKRINSDCFGNCLLGIKDECGVCGGEGAIYDCGCTNIPIGTCDCDANRLDDCGECNGNNLTCTGCTNVNAENYNPDATIDNGSCILDIILSGLPSTYNLEKIYPNPFNSIVKINYSLPENSDVNIFIYNLLGQLTTELIKSYMQAGYHSTIWDASLYPSGIYFIIMETGIYRESQKVLLIK